MKQKRKAYRRSYIICVADNMLTHQIVRKLHDGKKMMSFAELTSQICIQIEFFRKQVSTKSYFVVNRKKIIFC